MVRLEKNMFKIGDAVKVIRKTIDECGEEKEIIPIGTICRVLGYYDNDKNGLTLQIRPEGADCRIGEFWYRACDVEKGHMEWIKDE